MAETVTVENSWIYTDGFTLTLFFMTNEEVVIIQVCQRQKGPQNTALKIENFQSGIPCAILQCYLVPFLNLYGRDS